jgi:hypothetical protein
MQTLTRYLSNIMNSTLLSLPREIKELIYFDALSHAANKVLVRAAHWIPWKGVAYIGDRHCHSHPT